MLPSFPFDSIDGDAVVFLILFVANHYIFFLNDLLIVKTDNTLIFCQEQLQYPNRDMVILKQEKCIPTEEY